MLSWISSLKSAKYHYLLTFSIRSLTLSYQQISLELHLLPIIIVKLNIIILSNRWHNY